MTNIMIIGHPGHELRAYHWMEKNHPIVFALTDGSGSLSEGRIESTRRVVEQAGATSTSFFGQIKDAALYNDLLEKRTDSLFKAIVDIYQSITDLPKDKLTIVGDSAEGYNTAHDLTRYLINILCEQLRSDGYEVANYAFNLVDDPAEMAKHSKDEDIVHQIDDASFARKLNAARSYPELAEEVERAIAEASESSFKTEVFTRVPDESPAVERPEGKLFYETYGRKRVEEGKYKHLILYHDHVLPCALQLREDFRNHCKAARQ